MQELTYPLDNGMSLVAKLDVDCLGGITVGIRDAEGQWQRTLAVFGDHTVGHVQMLLFEDPTQPKRCTGAHGWHIPERA